jgi:hypothetical protein
MVDHMVKIRALSVVVALGLAPPDDGPPRRRLRHRGAGLDPRGRGRDKPALEKAIRAAVDDIATHAVAFTPTVVSLREAKLSTIASTCSC